MVCLVLISTFLIAIGWESGTMVCLVLICTFLIAISWDSGTTVCLVHKHYSRSFESMVFKSSTYNFCLIF